MNNYFQSFIDKFETVRSKEELTRTFEICCCGLKDEKGREIVHGCNRQASCSEGMCPVYKAYRLWFGIIDEVRKPTIVYVEGKTPSHIVTHTRKYKIKPVTQCKRTVTAQITKYIKHGQKIEQLNFIRALVDKDNFKRARIHAARNGFDKIVETLDKFINKGKLGTANSENK